MLELHRDEKTSWIKIQQRGKTSPDRKKNNRLLRADVVLDQQKADIYVTEYIEDSGDFPQYEKDKAAGRRDAAKIKGIFEVIRNYKIPIVIVEPNNGVDSICRIFETINSTGTKLTTFDLAVARFYPSPDLRKLWSTTQEKHSILKRFEVDGERVLQVLCLVTANHNQKDSKYVEPTRSNLMNLKPKLIHEEWEKSSEFLAKTYQWAVEQGARPKTLPRDSILVSIAAVRALIFSETGRDPLDSWKTNNDFIRRWYFSKVMQSSRAQSSNYQISLDFQALLEYARDDKRPELPQITLNTEILLKLKPSDACYKALQNILETTINQDLSGRFIVPGDQLHDHHIFPKNAHRKGLDRTMLDGICNRLTLLANSNQSLGEGYPKDYFKKMVDQARAEGTLGDFRRRIYDYFIPGNPEDRQWTDCFTTDRFEEFCRERAELIISRVKEIVGDSLQSKPISGDDEIEDYTD